MLEKIIKAIKEAQRPLSFDLKFEDIDDAGIKLLAETIKEANVSITLFMSSTIVTIEWLSSLAETIKQVRNDFTLCLVDSGIGAKGVSLLAQGIKEAKVSLNLNLGGNKIGYEGAKLFGDAIKDVRLPLNLCLSDNRIREDGARFLADGIKQAKGSLSISLSGNSVGNEGAKFFAVAIREKEAPLNLSLRDNLIGEEGIKQIAAAIEHAKSPITLDLSNNTIGDAAAHTLANAIKVARTPVALACAVYCRGVIGRKVLRDAMDDNFVVDARKDPSKFLARTGFNLVRKMLEQVLNYPAVLAILITSYISDDDLAWTEVATIRAVVGASYENKYSSIDVTLLNSAYFNTPVTVKPLMVVEPLLMTESTEKEGNYTSSVVTDNENKGDKNTDGVEGRESNSSSSTYFGYGETHLEKLSNQYSIDLQYGHYNHQQEIDNGKGHDTESLLIRFFAWIKDLPKHQKQEILSSFSMQRVLKVLEITRDKIIAEQLNSKQLEEIFTAEHQSYYEQESCIDSSQAYAHIKKLEPAMLLCGTETQMLGESNLLQKVIPI